MQTLPFALLLVSYKVSAIEHSDADQKAVVLPLVGMEIVHILEDELYCAGKASSACYDAQDGKNRSWTHDRHGQKDWLSKYCLG